MTKLIGILNLTPDSFSDGGAVTDCTARVAQLFADGADIVDIGAESTRPGATPHTHTEEWARLEGLVGSSRISIDTRHAETARKALALGVGIINDVGGLRDAAMRAVLADADCDIIVMHSLTIPADKNIVLPKKCDPVQMILEWKRQVIALAENSGIAQNRLIFDPGIGFGKTAEQSLALILHASELVQSGGRWLYGHSRKSFLTLFGDAPPAERDALTLAFSAQLADAGVQYLRVHDVAEHRRLWSAL